MSYHIDTGLIKDKFKTACDCPLCEIQQIVQEQFLHEFLNDAVMEDNTRIKVGQKGFCKEHFDMLFNRQNKLSVALQVGTRAEKTKELFQPIKSAGTAKKHADKILKAFSSCVICDLLEESMTKYYKTVAQLFVRESTFMKTLLSCGGFCSKHYAELLRYSSSAGFATKEYLGALSNVQMRGFTKLQADLKAFCDKHDYRNANQPLGSAENALPNTRTRFYGKKFD